METRNRSITAPQRPYAEECMKRIIALTGLTHGVFTPRWGKSACGSKNHLEALNINMVILEGGGDWESWKGGHESKTGECVFHDGKTDHPVGQYAAGLLYLVEGKLLQLSCTQMKEDQGEFMVFPSFAEMRLQHADAVGIDSVCIPFDDLERRLARERAMNGTNLPAWTGEYPLGASCNPASV